MESIRIKRIKNSLNQVCFVEDPNDLFYLTQMELSKGLLLIGEGEAILFVDGRYYEKALMEAPCKVEPWEAQKKLTIEKIGFDSRFVTYDAFLELEKQFPKLKWIPMPSPIQKFRMLKEEDEIKALKKAADLTKLGIAHVQKLLKVGVTEEELSFEFEFFCRKNGASALSFDPIIAFGENSAFPHYRAGKKKLKEGDVVLIDVGAVVDSYHGDMTRIFYFGDPDPRIVHLEKIVKEAQNIAIDQIKPGVKLGSLDNLVQETFEKHHVKQLYMHSLGHGIGLETHEFPRIRFDGEHKDLELEPGMVFTIEPGLYQLGLGGVRIEDMVLVTTSGYVKL